MEAQSARSVICDRMADRAFTLKGTAGSDARPFPLSPDFDARIGIFSNAVVAATPRQPCLSTMFGRTYANMLHREFR